MGACAGSRPLTSSGDLERPLRVMVVTIAREQAPPVSVRPGFSIGMVLGSLGSGVSGGVGMDIGRDGRAKPAVSFGDLDFRAAVQTLFISSAVAPSAWSWIDGDAADADTLDDIVKLNDKKSTKAEAARAWAVEHRINRVLVLEPTTWGFQRDEGFVVELQGRLFELGEKPRMVWQGRSGRKKAPTGRANDVSEPHRQLLAAAGAAVAALNAKLGG